MPATILKLPQVTQRTSLSRSHVYALIAEGAFPKQVRLGSRAVGWLESEVDSFIAARIAERDASPANEQEG
ncbi:AlpA family transcriptional regulator [Lysobacter sp. KIS68-7]|uniref:helix-turn-helix transcriptional regulator n=1 Tax=Lysobacter sp. KIS68-7 TaxID=2904252 RepID=UPI001E40AF81|nr:AlpA family transcriptional regulator [Lysobacter sp. KIS68-7]UHQ19405.1 AlpA family transcriptional regulator [Lysobacter sp. KIS68-7]